ncbi:hypothetical protein EW026_g4594 [Hermanssonia centrifuga]|uniref:Uncharacterized protein n=1 Tax=Hermanssonia centrifuga TaxID=98765 RepID=A0A4S4KGY8_9APHY|nr:hypothetical protein EW026_g4594 [Hermanssonia centrifuga]
MAKATQKKKQTVAPPPTRISTRAKNANTHPGLVDISEESDPEKVQRNSKRKAVRVKAKEVKEKKAANVAELELLIVKLQNEIAQRDAREVVTSSEWNRRASIAEQLASPGYSIEEMEGPIVPPSSPIEEGPIVPPSSPIEEMPDDDIMMAGGESGCYRDGSEPSQSPFHSEGGATDRADEMEVEETDIEPSGVADVAVVPGGPLRRSSAAFFGRNNHGEVVILDRVPSEHTYDLNSEPLSKKRDQPKKRKATAHEEDLPEASGSLSHGGTKTLGKQPSKPLASTSSSSLAGGGTTSDASVSRASTPSPSMLISSNVASSIEATQTLVLKSTATTRDTSLMNVAVNASTSESAAKGKGKTPTLRLNPRTLAEPEKPLRIARSRRKTPATSDVPLPNIKNSRAIWRGQVIPSYISFVATLENPWDADSTGDEIDALQQSWSTAFPDHRVLVRPATSIHKVATQRLYEWRSNVGKRGIAAVEWLWEDKALAYEEERRDYVATHLGPHFLCMYKDEIVWLSLLSLWGKIQTEKEQQDDIKSALDKGDAKLAKDLKAFHVKLRTFSEGSWSKPTQDYVKVMTKLSEVQWGRIMRAGMKHVKQSKGSLKIPEEDEDERAMMIVDSDDDGYSGNSE